MENEVLRAIESRHSKRAYLRDPVSEDVLNRIFSAAAHAPSSQNSQPWAVEVVRGRALRELSDRLCRAFDEQTATTPHYRNRPAPLDEVLAGRVAEYGKSFFAHKGIGRGDEAARRHHRRENFLFFGAPVELIFHLPANAVAGTFLDLGCFMQNVMLGCVSCGLASCPQFSVASYGDLVRATLGLGEDRIVIAGMAVGHPDGGAPVNEFIPARAPLDEFITWRE